MERLGVRNHHFIDDVSQDEKSKTNAIIKTCLIWIINCYKIIAGSFLVFFNYSKCSNCSLIDNIKESNYLLFSCINLATFLALMGLYIFEIIRESYLFTYLIDDRGLGDDLQENNRMWVYKNKPIWISEFNEQLLELHGQQYPKLDIRHHMINNYLKPITIIDQKQKHVILYLHWYNKIIKYLTVLCICCVICNFIGSCWFLYTDVRIIFTLFTLILPISSKLYTLSTIRFHKNESSLITKPVQYNRFSQDITISYQRNIKPINYKLWPSEELLLKEMTRFNGDKQKDLLEELSNEYRILYDFNKYSDMRFSIQKNIAKIYSNNRNLNLMVHSSMIDDSIIELIKAILSEWLLKSQHDGKDYKYITYIINNPKESITNKDNVVSNLVDILKKSIKLSEHVSRSDFNHYAEHENSFHSIIVNSSNPCVVSGISNIPEPDISETENIENREPGISSIPGSPEYIVTDNIDQPSVKKYSRFKSFQKESIDKENVVELMNMSLSFIGQLSKKV